MAVIAPPGSEDELWKAVLAELAISAKAAEREDALAWRAIARPAQLPPDGSWSFWLYMAGRGTGKTRAGAEWIHEQVEAGHRRIALVAPTAADARDVMVEGETGILNTGRVRPVYEPSKRRVTWPNGAIATLYSADEPERLRGPQHDAAWCDELGSWRYEAAWSNLLFGLRLGDDPRALITTTPRPTPLMRSIIDDPACVMTHESTYANIANLAPTFRAQVIRRYEGTRLGRQELEGELLTDTPGALWTLDTFDEGRVSEHPDLVRIVVAIDPSGGRDPENDEQGIIVAGLGADGHGYVIDDRTCRLSPDGWGREAVQAYLDHEADGIVAETNYGGDMVIATVKAAASAMDAGPVPTKKIVASRGKRIRAEPVAALYEQGRVHHVGTFAKLEDQMAEWTPNSRTSPDRMDALVWAITELMGGTKKRRGIVQYRNPVTIGPRL